MKEEKKRKYQSNAEKCKMREGNKSMTKDARNKEEKKRLSRKKKYMGR